MERARAIGIWASVGGLAAASGPVFGAILTSWFGWRGVFFVNVPVGLLGMLLTMRYVIADKKIPQGSFDFLGQIVGIISIATLAFSLIEAGRLGWTSEIVMSGLCIFLATFIFFLVIEHRSLSPMFPLIFFKSRTFSVSMAVGMILNIGFYGQLFLLPLYFQQLRGYSVLMTGLAILPQTGLAALASYFGGKVASVSGPKLPMVVGLAIGALGFFSMLIAGANSPSYFLLMLPLAAIGFGVTFTMPASTIAIINSVPSERTGIASGAFNTSRQIGSLIGVAVFGTILNTAPSFISGMHIGLIMGGVSFVLGCIATLLWIA
jgi:DHA2 family methylenomycin A resistance protein-like MFS transporter